MNRVFGQATGKGRGSRNANQRHFGNHSIQESELSEQDIAAERRAQYRRQKRQDGESLDVEFGYVPFDNKVEEKCRRGWLFNMLPTTVAFQDEDSDNSSGSEKSALDLYFCADNGTAFKATVLHSPYFYVLASEPEDMEDQALFFESLLSCLSRMYESSGLRCIEIVSKIDLDQRNHLSPSKSTGRQMLKLTFDNVQQLMDVRKRIQNIVRKNLSRQSDVAMYIPNESNNSIDPISSLVELREFDVPYQVRVCIDLNIRAGAWYTVTPNKENPGVTLSDQDIETKANPVYMAFDIECTKAALKFPDASHDSIFMISYMVNGEGYLILSRSVVSQDVRDFEYTPKPSYPGPFKIFNENTEESLLRRFFDEYKRHRPQIVVTYNGDFFDWPFVEQRARTYGMDIGKELGIERQNDGEYRGRFSVHLDAFHWVQRDSYLPQGSQGLKAVTKYKLGYDPVEVDPEDMVRYAQEKPVHMATYSVSDAVATYYLYELYVHMFIFSLCTIIPMGPEDVLRKGSGTLCETLLMVEACEKSIICPNKQIDHLAKFHNGHLLESETYIGGKVECLETGVYRSDIKYDFDLKPSAFQMLIDNIDRDLAFAIEVELGGDRTKVTNYNEVRSHIVEQLEMLRDRPIRSEKPYIYHLDVGAMYPNIILTNRLQPNAIVDDATCAGCDYNQAKNDCKRRMEWVWRGDYTPATKQEYDRTIDQLNRELCDGEPFKNLPAQQQAVIVASRLKTYTRNAYKKTKITEEITKSDTVCMRENDFYVETVRRFRDRRYELKKMTKTWQKKAANLQDASLKRSAEDRVIVYDSLQVAHKCILNSFYGYVMRKGARWRSMEMAGIVTKTGADLITQARILVEQIGRPLELDTDGIWCILPKSFPNIFTFNISDGSNLKLEYPCVMLNADVHENFTNHQYQTLKDPKRGIYEMRSECSIFFEVDGPYRCMVLPASTEEGKLLKKRYAVFNLDGSLAELKGFELKRRGELELIKTFQSQVFQRFLDGGTLEECYASVADVANHWMDVLDSRGESLETDELFELISENRSMSRQLQDYGDQKGTSQTTARRLSEFLGAEIIKDKGLNCKFIIAEQPYGAPVTERAIPTAIWKAEPVIMKHYLRKWLKSYELEDDDFDIRSILDWNYYAERLAKSIQKIITIPAALQKINNPVPRVSHPDWLLSKLRQISDNFQQTNLHAFLTSAKVPSKNVNQISDLEDFGLKSMGKLNGALVHKRKIAKTISATSHKTDEIQMMPDKRIPLKGDNFQDWLKQRKSDWSLKFRERKMLRKSNIVSRPQSDVGVVRRPLSSMQGYIREAAVALMQNEWHIIELRELTSSDGNSNASSGDFILWIMVNSNSLRKIQVSVPRILYFTTNCEIMVKSSTEIQVRKVDKHLPRNQHSSFLYELTMPEHMYRSGNWIDYILECRNDDNSIVFENLYETSHPLMLRALSELGCLVKVDKSSSDKIGNVFHLGELQRVNKPLGGEYMNSTLKYKKIFLYHGVNPKSKQGIIAVINIEENQADPVLDIALWDEERGEKNCKETSSVFVAICTVWVVKPGSSRSAQQNVTKRQCETLFTKLLETIHEISIQNEKNDQKSDYCSISPTSKCTVENLVFVDDEASGSAQAHEHINNRAKGNNGPAFLILNSAKTLRQVRNSIPSIISFPVISLPFPPGPAHNPSTMGLPALNWEQPAIQLVMEAFFYMIAVSFPKRVKYARYGQIPIGNFGDDECKTLYDVCLSRQLVKSRAVSWACPKYGHPDLGVPMLKTVDDIDGIFSGGDDLETLNELIWSDEEDLISPIIRNSGSYRNICVELDVHDLAIAALTDMIDSGCATPASPVGVTMFPSASRSIALGDDTCTSISLPLLRVIVANWLRDAFNSNVQVADDLLHHTYRLVSSPDSLFFEPLLHRAIHSMMKTTFFRLLGELQRLGCTIILGSFHKIIVATKKVSFHEAFEYIEFVTSSIAKKSSENGSGGIERISLHPSRFFSHVLFYDEYNYGGIELERVKGQEDLDSTDLIMEEESSGQEPVFIAPSVITGWSIRNYLGSAVAQEYFRVVIARFSKDIFRKEQKLLREKDKDSICNEILEYKRKVICKHFASDLARAVDEIIKEDNGIESLPHFPGSDVSSSNPALEFIKSVTTILDLDSEVQKEVQSLKRGLLAQIGVAEYSHAARWENPSAVFVLSDLFCHECHESRDVNLCEIPQLEGESAPRRHWCCDECGTHYDPELIEERLLATATKLALRYQMQDLRCPKTNRVSTKALARHSDASTEFQLDISRNGTHSQFEMLHSIAKHHEFELLEEITADILNKHVSEYIEHA